MQTLTQLIAERRGDKSIDALAARTTGVSSERLRKLANGNQLQEFPSAAVIRAIAEALRVTEREVVLAIATQLQFDMSGPGTNDTDLAIRGGAALHREVKLALTTLSEHLLTTTSTATVTQLHPHNVETFDLDRDRLVADETPTDPHPEPEHP